MARTPLGSLPQRDSYLLTCRGTCVLIEHMFVMIACLSIPGFELRAALRSRPRLAFAPAALAPEPGREPLLGPVTAAAEAAGVKAGMRLGEALALCPDLELVDSDEQAPAFLAPRPLELLPLELKRREELHELGVRTVGDLAALPGPAVA